MVFVHIFSFACISCSVVHKAVLGDNKQLGEGISARAIEGKLALEGPRFVCLPILQSSSLGYTVHLVYCGSPFAHRGLRKRQVAAEAVAEAVEEEVRPMVAAAIAAAAAAATQGTQPLQARPVVLAVVACA